MSDEFRPGEQESPIPDNSTPANNGSAAANDDQTAYIPGNQAPQYQQPPVPPASPVPPAGEQPTPPPPVPPHQTPPYPYDQQPPSYQPTYQQPGFSPYPPQQPGNGMAVASLVMGILSLIFCCIWVLPFLFAILGLIFGCVAKSKGAGGMATAGIILSVCGALLSIIWIVLAATGISNLSYFYNYYYY